MTKLVVGVFDNMESAVEAVDQLKAAQIDNTAITILSEDSQYLRPVAVELSRPQPDKFTTGFAIAGVICGLVIGLVSALLPGTSSLIAATPLLSALSGAFVGGCLGAVIGALVHFDIPDTDAKILEGESTAGNLLVVIHTDESQQRLKAEEILDRTGAIEIDTKAA